MLDLVKGAIHAARFDLSFYNQIENDRSYTKRALVVVLVGWTAIGIGNWLADMSWSTALGIVWAIVGGTTGWVAWSAIATVIGTRLYRGTADLGQMLRVLGFAQAPLVIGIVPRLDVVGYVWALVASVFAIREGMEFTTGRALFTVLTGGVLVGLFVLAALWIL